MGERLGAVLRLWIPLAIAIVGVCGTLYLTVQQSYRLGLNDPQVQLAQDGARVLASGASPASVAGSGTVDVAEDLAPYVAVYDRQAQPAASNGRLDGRPPQPPRGVFDVARAKGENRVSWQPRAGVRSAIVVVYARQGSREGFVLAGRNMREVESRIGLLGVQVLAGMLVTLAVVLGASVLVTARR